MARPITLFTYQVLSVPTVRPCIERNGIHMSTPYAVPSTGGATKPAGITPITSRDV